MGLDMLEVAPLEEFIVAAAPLEGFIFAANEKLDTEASPTARHTLLRTLLNLPTRPMNLPTLLPTNRPTPTTPLHPSVVLMLEATESLPDLFEPLPMRRPLFLWKRDMASLGLLELFLLNEKCVMDSLGLGLPTLPPPTTLGLPTLPPPTLLRLPTRRTTPL